MRKEGRTILIIVVLIALLANVGVASVPEWRLAVQIQYMVLGISIVAIVAVLFAYRNK